MANITDGSNGANGTNGIDRTNSTSAKLLWKHPNPQTTPMYKYLQAVNQEHNLQLSTYPELHDWSIRNIDAFWQSVWKFVGIKADGDASPVSRGALNRDRNIDSIRHLIQMRQCFLVPHSSKMRA